MVLCVVCGSSCKRAPSAENRRAVPAADVQTVHSKPEKVSVAYKGRFSGDEGETALIQDVLTGSASFKSAGQEAFGYVVLEIHSDWVVLEKNGAQIKLEVSRAQ